MIGKSRETSDVTMSGTMEEANSVENETKPDQATSVDEDAKAETVTKARDVSDQAKPQLETETVQRPVTSSGWLGGWLGRSGVQPSDSAKSAAQEVAEEAYVAKEDQPQGQQTIAEDSAKKPAVSEAPVAPSSSWFGLWSTAAPSTAVEAPKEQLPVKVDGNGTDTTKKDSSGMKDSPTKPPEQPAAGSSWAFWTSDSKKSTNSPESENLGELAVAGEPSQNQPEPAKAATVKEDKKSKSSKRGRPLSTVSVEVDDYPKKAVQPEVTSAASTKGTPATQSPAPSKTSSPNILIPSVKSTYRLVENPSILQQIARLLIHDQQKPVNHVGLVKDTPRIKKALAIGIHGLFPAPLLRTVIGQPTGFFSLLFPLSLFLFSKAERLRPVSGADKTALNAHEILKSSRSC
jgi:hypothetical protein